MSERDFYRILGVAKNANQKEIDEAYKTLAQKFHPDRNRGNKEAEERFKEITYARSVLSDEKKRAGLRRRCLHV